MATKPQKYKRGPGRPATGKTPQRIFRMADEEWSIVQRRADKAGVTVSEFIRQKLLKS